MVGCFHFSQSLKQLDASSLDSNNWNEETISAIFRGAIFVFFTDFPLSTKRWQRTEATERIFCRIRF